MTNGALIFYQNATQHLKSVANAYRFFVNSNLESKRELLRVIDVGCGSGRVFYEVILPLLPKNTTEIVGADVDENMLEFSRSMNKDPRVSFERLDIAAKELPKHLQNKFDLLFSSYCFTYVTNLRQGFTNCRNLLKPDGEMSLLFQFKMNGLYSTYKKMSSLDRWKPYTKDYTEYVTHFSGPNPELELKKIFKDVGMTLVSHKFDHDFSFYMTKREILDNHRAFDLKYLTLSQNEQYPYMVDFVRILSEVLDMDFTDEKTLDNHVHFTFPTVYMHAKKA